MGWSECHSQATNPATRATPPTSAAITSGDDHPWAGPSMMAQRMPPRPPIDNRAPAGSARRGFALRDSGTSSRVPTRPAATTGTLTRNTDPHRPPPQADGPSPLGGVAEDVVDDREARRDGHGGARPHERPPRDEGIDAPREGGAERATPENDQPGAEERLAPEAVGQAAGHEQQAPEHHRVGVDDPLELVGGGLQLLRPRGQRHFP